MSRARSQPGGRVWRGVVMGRGDFDTLRELLVGHTIEAVDKPDPGVSEAICKVTASKGGKVLDFHLHATNLGWWVGEHRSLREQPDGTLVPVWGDFDQFIEAITDHLISSAMEDWEGEGSPLVAQDDPLTRCTGFRCLHTGQEWWVSFPAARKFSYRCPGMWSSIQAREQVAEFLGVHHYLPATVLDLVS